MRTVPASRFPALPSSRARRRHGAVRRTTVGVGVALSLALCSVAAGPAAGAVPTVPAPPDPRPTPMDVPGPADDDGQQRWAPPLAGATHAVAVTDGAVRLDPARDGAATPASLRGNGRFGLLEVGSHRFGTPVNQLDVPVDAEIPPGTAVEADVRGQGADGRWSEWMPATRGAPALLDEPTRTVELRLVLMAGPTGPSPAVRSVQVLADRTDTAPRVIAPRASHRVFATREGLVGGTTANGHKIVPRDQFVALPSRRALSPKKRGDYSVRVCTDARRCATVPVWDVGPWNTTDDYWNPSTIRQRWKDLPLGLPQAQAAFNDRYNGGKDGFGRAVKNPAGIDLADGTFWGLGLRDNAWVTVDYLWTSRAAVVGRAVAPTGAVLLRPQPTEATGDIGVIGDGAQVGIDCQVAGAPVLGALGTSSLWYRVAPDQFAPAAFVADAPPVPPCAG